LASAASRPRDDRELTVLKRVQSVLGHVHDRELIMQRLDQSREQGAEIETLRQRLIAERDGLFKDYLSRRDDLYEVSEAIRRRTAERARRWMPLAALVAVPSALVIGLAGGRQMRQSARRHSNLEPFRRGVEAGL
jgi:hypothetical protein